MQEEQVLKGFAIVVASRGFVYVGDVVADSNWAVITNARNIRRWGTKRGLGQLALEGPQENTDLDPCGTVRIPAHALEHLIDTEADKWILDR